MLGTHLALRSSGLRRPPRGEDAGTRSSHDAVRSRGLECVGLLTVSKATYDVLLARLDAVEVAVKSNANTIRSTSSKVGEIKMVAAKS